MPADVQGRAIALVTERHGPGNAQSPQIVEINQHFLAGELYRVEFTGKDKKKYENYVYFEGKDATICLNDSELLNLAKIRSAKESFFIRLMKTAGVPGSIAIVITATICWLTLNGHEIPDVLANALTAILGFYFAATVYESTR
jgi:hypothetical protein